MKITCGVCQSTLERPIENEEEAFYTMEKWAEIHRACIEFALKRDAAREDAARSILECSG